MPLPWIKRDKTTAPSAPPPAGEQSTLYSTSGDYGLRVLADPKDANLDIVFVHGLTGNRETTWGGNELWPQQLLPEDMPKARITTFGYDADVVWAIDIASSNTIRDHGKALATELARKRLFDGCKERPLIFVAHSLGGLVCEQALLISRGTADDWLLALLSSTAGILFLGTPHAGSNLADWGSILTNITKIARPTNKSLVYILRPGSEMLANLQQEFHGMLEARQTRGDSVPRIYCFFEELPYAHGVGHVVPSHSAVLPRYGSQSVGANHVDMTKFNDRSEQGYQNVAGQLRIWAMEVEQASVGSEARRVAEAQSAGGSGIGSVAGSSAQRPGHVYSGVVHSNGGQVFQGNMNSSGDINLSFGGPRRPGSD